VVNEEHREACEQQQQQRQHQQHKTSYLDFLATHSHVFAKATNPLETDSWLHKTEAKFGLLHCSEMQKMLSRPSLFAGP
jgi:hypothetical protein